MQIKDEDLGREIIVREKYNQFYLSTITRLTKTQAISENGGRYRRVDGYVVGGDRWVNDRIEVITPTIQAEIDRKNVENKVYYYSRNKGWRLLSYDQLTRIWEIIEEGTA